MLVVVMSLMAAAFTRVEKLGLAIVITVTLGMLRDPADPIFAWTLSASLLVPIAFVSFKRPRDGAAPAPG